MLGSWLTPHIASTLNGSEDSMFPYIVLLALGLTLGVVHSAREAQRISQLPPSGLASLIPRIQVDWPAGEAAPTVRRIGA